MNTLIKQHRLTLPSSRMIAVEHDGSKELANIMCTVIEIELDGYPSLGGTLIIRTNELDWITRQLDIQQKSITGDGEQLQSYKLDLHFDDVLGVSDVEALGCFVKQADWGDLIWENGDEGVILTCEFVVDLFPDDTRYGRFKEDG